MSEPIRITRATAKKPHPRDNELGFGTVFTDHMFVADFQEEKGWYDPRIEPYGPLALDPAAAVLHYAQAIFDGLKAFRGKDGKVRLFRPQKHIERMNHSARRLCVPGLDPEFALQSLVTLVGLEKDWVPSSVGTALYVRPVIIANEPFLGVRPAKSYIYYVILSPVGAYYAEGMNPVKIRVEDKHVRATPGMGAAKTGGNYAASLYAAEEAHKAGFTQVLWLDATHRKYVDEVGTMNIMFRLGDEVVTPPLAGTILPGVTRDSALTLDARVGPEGLRAPGRDRRGAGRRPQGHAARGVGHRHRRRHLARGRAVVQGRALRHRRRQDRRADPEALHGHRGHPVRAGARHPRLDRRGVNEWASGVVQSRASRRTQLTC